MTKLMEKAAAAAAPTVTRFGLLDRTWAGHYTALVITPVAMPAIEDVRRMWRALATRHPDSPFVGRFDSRGWVRVAEAERDAFTDTTIVHIEDPAPDQVDAFLPEAFPMLAEDRPILIGVGRRSLLILVTHQLGDAASTTILARALLRSDPDALEAVTRTATMRDVVAAFRAQVGAHGREWLAIAKRQLTDRGRATSAPAVTPPASGWNSSVVSVQWSPADLRMLSLWRTRNAKGTSMAAVITAAAHRALVEAGIPLAEDGFHTLVDLRRYLPASDRPFLPGNMAKSIRLDVDVTDIRAVSDAVKETVDSARPIASTLLGGLAGAAARPRTEHGEPVAGPVGLTFNSMPDLPGLSDLPWLDDGPRQYLGCGMPAAPSGVTVFVMGMRTVTQVTAVFPSWMADRDAVRHALQSLPERIAELARPLPTA